jgi:hypothetical protein
MQTQGVCPVCGGEGDKFCVDLVGQKDVADHKGLELESHLVRERVEYIGTGKDGLGDYPEDRLFLGHAKNTTPPPESFRDLGGALP